MKSFEVKFMCKRCLSERTWTSTGTRTCPSKPWIGKVWEHGQCCFVMTLLHQYLRYRAIPPNSGLWICRASANN